MVANVRVFNFARDEKGKRYLDFATLGSNQVYDLVRKTAIEAPEYTQTSSSLLSKLPREIRDEIWRYVCHHTNQHLRAKWYCLDGLPSASLAWIHFGTLVMVRRRAFDQTPQLLRVSRQVYFEAQSFLYMDIEFQFTARSMLLTYDDPKSSIVPGGEGPFAWPLGIQHLTVIVDTLEDIVPFTTLFESNLWPSIKRLTLRWDPNCENENNEFSKEVQKFRQNLPPGIELAVRMKDNGLFRPHADNRQLARLPRMDANVTIQVLAQ